MAFIFCDDHDIELEAEGVDPATAKQFILDEHKASSTSAEKQIIEFGLGHRKCSVRILPD